MPILNKNINSHMQEIWRYSHTTTVGCKKSKEIMYYYSSEGRLKKVWYNGKIEITTPKKSGHNERIYITIAKLFPEICGEYFDGCQIDHINTNRFDNRAVNLRCCTAKENMQNVLTRQHCSDACKQRWADGVYKNWSDKIKQQWADGVYKKSNFSHPAWNKGKTGYKTKPCSEERKKKISAANKGRTSPMKGKKFSEEHKKKISLSHIGRRWYIGEDGKRHY